MAVVALVAHLSISGGLVGHRWDTLHLVDQMALTIIFVFVYFINYKILYF